MSGKIDGTINQNKLSKINDIYIISSYYQNKLINQPMSLRLQNLERQLVQEPTLLQKLRKQHPICRKEVRNLIYGEKYALLADQCFDVILKNRHIFEHADIEEHSRKQERQKHAKMVLAYHSLRPFKGPQYLTDPHSLTITAHVTYNFDPGFSVKCDISTFLYGKTIYNFGRKDSQLHQNLWNRALALQDIGCFGLTEFGHGSNVKNMETEAVYDKERKEFVLNMPTKQAMKFWIGAAAQLANMSVIWAQLVLDGKRYGPHPFLVPLRNPQTMELLPGVTVGDCGHKNGLNGIDNGYIILNHVRIPKSQALDAISGVNDQGEFWAIVQNADKRLGMYMNPLSVGRSFVAANSITSSASALAIAIRYATQRRQFSGPKQTEEKIILEYPLTKLRLMSLLAKNFVYFFGGLNILRLYDAQIKNLTNPKNKLLNQMHAISSVAKAQSSWFVVQAITECREILGGHGYSSYSRLGRLFNDNDINSTWEGDNNMLLQQTTKYVLKTASRIQRGKMFDDSLLLFLKDGVALPEKLESSHFDDLKILEDIIKSRISAMIQETMAFMLKMKGQNAQDMDVWNYAQPYYGKKLAFAFGDLYYFGIISSKLSEMSANLKQMTEQCVRLWILTTLEKQRWGDFETRKIIQQKILQLCDWLTPRSVSLIDSIAAPSQIIGSPFADEDGEGMRKYLNLVFTGKNTFKRVDWFDKIVQLKNNK